MAGDGGVEEKEEGEEKIKGREEEKVTPAPEEMLTEVPAGWDGEKDEEER